MTHPIPFAGSKPYAVWRTLAVALLLVPAVAACGSSKGGLSVTDRANTLSVCTDAASDVKDASVVAEKAASGQVTQSEAQAQLAPIAAKVQDLASKNANLPVGTSLTTLSKDITALQKITPSDAAALKTAASQLGTDVKAVLSSCAAVGQ
jgi:hypothetical protein